MWYSSWDLKEQWDQTCTDLGSASSTPGLKDGTCKVPMAGLSLANMKTWDVSDQEGQSDEVNITLVKPGIVLNGLGKLWVVLSTSMLWNDLWCQEFVPIAVHRKDSKGKTGYNEINYWYITNISIVLEWEINPGGSGWIWAMFYDQKQVFSLLILCTWYVRKAKHWHGLLVFEL